MALTVVIAGINTGRNYEFCYVNKNVIKKVFLNRQKTGRPNMAIPVFSFKHPLGYNRIGVGAALSRVFNN